jgi:thiol-disulfide isomerase/thioredoxin
MKKIYLSILSLVMAAGISTAQTSLTTAPNFTVTDTHGNTHDLYSILATGKYVCVDFFFVTCPPCQQTVPYYKQAYTNYGCNTQDVFFISIDNGDNNAQVDAYETTYLGGPGGYPAVSGTEGGGDAVCGAYGIGAYPTYILIAPDKSIVEQDMWPISSAADFDAFLSTHSLTHKACMVGIDENNFSAAISAYPNPATDRLTVELANGEQMASVKLVDMMGRTVVSQQVNAAARTELDLSGLAKGMYYVEVTGGNNLRGLSKFVKE